MAEKRVKIGKEFEYIPAVKTGRGWLGLEKGKFGNVSFDATRKKLILAVDSGETYPDGRKKLHREFFAVEDYAKANEKARQANRIGEQSGADFGALREEEKAALTLWRKYVLEETKKGKPPRKLDEILRELIERERHKDETPLFEKVAFEFLEYKEREKRAQLDYLDRLKSYLNQLSKAFKGVPLSDITEEKFLNVLSRVARARDGVSPAAPKTLNHWIDVMKELFKWWYTRENKRRLRERLPLLDNPLELLAKRKIKRTRAPEILSVPDARALLVDLFEHSPSAVPVVAVQMFCGVRNAEALRLHWRDIRENEIFLTREITKTNEDRNSPVSENLRAWFDACKIKGIAGKPDELVFGGKETPPDVLAGKSDDERERIINSEFKARKSSLTKILARAQRRTGIRKPQNSFRHTAVSCLCQLYTFDEVADWCGHDRRTQGKYYRTAVSKQDAQDYFGIMPPTAGKPAIVFSRTAKANGDALDTAGAPASNDSRDETDGQDAESLFSA